MHSYMQSDDEIDDERRYKSDDVNKDELGCERMHY